MAESMVLKSAKAELTQDQRMMFDNEYAKKEKKVLTAYLLLIFLGVLGIHKFYLKKTGLGVAYLFTWGLLTIGVIIDLFTTVKDVAELNERTAKDVIMEVKMITKKG